jgi:hypothetical protein
MFAKKKHKGEFRNDNKKVAANNSGGALCGMLLTAGVGALFARKQYSP